MATQHPEQERLSMRARPELGQMRTKHMSPWQPSKNKIERVREAGGTRISSDWIEYTYVRIICVCDLWCHQWTDGTSTDCTFHAIVLFWKVLAVRTLLCDMYDLHPIPIQSVPAQLKFQSMKLERRGGFAPHWDTFILPAFRFSCDCTVINCWIILPYIPYITWNCCLLMICGDFQFP